MATTTATPIDAAASGTFNLGGDLPIHRMGYGAMRLTGEGVWGDAPDREEAKRVLRRALDLGINFIDTAEAYGPHTNEVLIADALHPYGKGLVLATKGGLARTGPGAWPMVGRPEILQQGVELSLRRLKLERLDLWQLHRIDPKVPVEESLAPIAKLQKEGKIRHVGLSEVKPHEIEQARKILPIVSVQNQYNIGDRQHEDTLEYCEQNNIAFIPWYPVASGKLAKRHDATVAQLALAWLLYRSPVMLPIPGTSSVAHLEENTAAANLHLDDAEWRAIEQEVEQSK